MPTKRIFASAQDVEAAFYDALERGDLETMMSVWAEDEDIVCVHPGGPRLLGYVEIREAWRRIFDAGNRFSVRVVQQSTVTTPFAVVSCVLEQVAQRDNRSQQAPVAATNVVVRGALGWRLVAHHASAVPPLSLGEVPQTLH